MIPVGHKRYLLIVQIIFVSIVVLAFYWAGLSASYLLDDENSLRSLVDMGGRLRYSSLMRFTWAGSTGPLGRPLSLLTFALNAQTWPTEAFPLLLTNVVIHALNGALVFLFLQKLLANNSQDDRRQYLCAFAAFLWVIHPYHVSTVLYVVQRMTLLATTFTLITLIFYLKGRANAIEGRERGSILFFALAILASLLAILSKESAILIPIQILVVEGYLTLTGQKFSGKLGVVIRAGAITGTLIILSFLGNTLVRHLLEFIRTGVEQTYGRNFTMSERLLTESRIVWEYLQGILLPKIQSSGVFQDGYSISSSLFSPLSTFLSLCLHASLVFAACKYRSAYPLAFFGVLWFYTSLILESTVVMLELKFEHRNYLPSLGIIVIFADLILAIKRQSIRRVAALAVSTTFALTLFGATSLWGNNSKAASVWIEENPSSARALEHAAKLAFEAGDYENAKKFIRKEVEITSSPAAELRHIAAFCESYNHSEPDWSFIASRISRDQRDWSLHSTIEKILEGMLTNRCDLVSLENFRLLLQAYRHNQIYAGNSSLLLMDNFEIAALIHFQKMDEALNIDEDSLNASTYVPLAYVMMRAASFAGGDRKLYAARRLMAAINVAKLSGVEDDYTVRGAEEMLTLIQADDKTDPSVQ